MTKSAVNWSAASLQVALFAKSPIPKSDVYYALVGEHPDSSEDRPKEGIYRQTGKLGEDQLQVGMNPVRLDIVLAPNQEAILGGGEMIRVAMGPFSEQLQNFAKMIRVWLPKFEVPLSRISLIAAAVAESESREESYKIIGDQLKSLKVSPEMGELLFRVNWKAKTDLLDEGFLNRLTTWSAFKLRVAAGVSPDHMVSMHDKNFARLDLDINSPAERRDQIEPGKLLQVFDSLVNLADENVARGEI